MKQIDRLLIKARKISIEYGEDVIVISFSGGEWVSGGRCFQSLEGAEQFFSENAKADLLFIVNDIGTPGCHPLAVLISRQKARYRRREKRRQLADEKERLKMETLKRLKQAEARQEQEKAAREKQEQRRKTVGRVI